MSLARFLMEKSVFAVVPLLLVVGVAVVPREMPAPAPASADPWAVAPPSTGEKLAALAGDLGERLGIGTARAAGGEDSSAAFAYEKARIAAIYARHGYNRKATARQLGTDVAGLQRTLRRYAIIEWPEGHRSL